MDRVLAEDGHVLLIRCHDKQCQSNPTIPIVCRTHEAQQSLSLDIRVTCSHVLMHEN